MGCSLLGFCVWVLGLGSFVSEFRARVMWYVSRDIYGSIGALTLAFIHSRLYSSPCRRMQMWLLVYLWRGVERLSGFREGTYIVRFNRGLS